MRVVAWPVVRFLWAALPAVLLAQGRPEPRAKASDYAASAVIAEARAGGRSSSIVLAAESLAHSIPVAGSNGGVLFAENHLVVEVAFFGAADGKQRLAMGSGDFTLLINGKKAALLPDAPGAVAAAMRNSAWNPGPHMEATAGVNNANVILGRRYPETGAPDIDGRNRGPAPPRAPGAEDRSGGLATQKPVDVAAEVERAALPRCECVLPVAGLLYFPYRGKLKGIREMVLQYHPQTDRSGDGTAAAAAPVSIRLNP